MPCVRSDSSAAKMCANSVPNSGNPARTNLHTGTVGQVPPPCPHHPFASLRKRFPPAISSLRLRWETRVALAGSAEARGSGASRNERNGMACSKPGLGCIARLRRTAAALVVAELAFPPGVMLFVSQCSSRSGRLDRSWRQMKMGTSKANRSNSVA
jgi:hypothetical protein